MQTVFERYGRSITVSVPFTEEELLKFTPTVRYLVEYGWKQSLSDSYAAAKNADEFDGKLMARHKAILDGTVRSPGTGTAKGPRLSPLEREMLHIATTFMAGVFEKNAKKGKPVAKGDQKAYIELYLDKNREEIRLKAEANIEANAQRVAESEDILDQLIAEVNENDQPEEVAEGVVDHDPKPRKKK